MGYLFIYFTYSCLSVVISALTNACNFRELLNSNANVSTVQVFCTGALCKALVITFFPNNSSQFAKQSSKISSKPTLEDMSQEPRCAFKHRQIRQIDTFLSFLQTIDKENNTHILNLGLCTRTTYNLTTILSTPVDTTIIIINNKC